MLGAASVPVVRSPVNFSGRAALYLSVIANDGIELLEKILATEKYHDSIVFVLTTSTDDRDKFEAYNLNAAGYMLKSDMRASFIRAIEFVEQYWKVVEFPGTD